MINLFVFTYRKNSILSLYHLNECNVFPFILYSHDISILCLKSTTSGTSISSSAFTITAAAAASIKHTQKAKKEKYKFTCSLNTYGFSPLNMSNGVFSSSFLICNDFSFHTKKKRFDLPVIHIFQITFPILTRQMHSMYSMYCVASNCREINKKKTEYV